MHQKYYEITRFRTFVAVALAAVILSIQAFAHLEIHCDIPEPARERMEKEAEERKAREAFDRYESDPDNASDRDTTEASNYVRDYTN